MDGPPAVSISMDPVTRDVMRRPPRPKNASILSQRLLARVGFSAAVILSGVLYILAREIKSSSGHRDQTMVSFHFADAHKSIKANSIHLLRLLLPSFSSTLHQLFKIEV